MQASSGVTSEAGKARLPSERSGGRRAFVY